VAIEVSWSDNLLGLMEHGSELSKIALKARFTQPKIMTCPRHLIFSELVRKLMEAIGQRQSAWFGARRLRHWQIGIHPGFAEG